MSMERFSRQRPKRDLYRLLVLLTILAIVSSTAATGIAEARFATGSTASIASGTGGDSNLYGPKDSKNDNSDKGKNTGKDKSATQVPKPGGKPTQVPQRDPGNPPDPQCHPGHDVELVGGLTVVGNH